LPGHVTLLRKPRAKLAFWLRTATSFDSGRPIQAEGRVTILSSLKSWARTIQRDVVAFGSRHAILVCRITPRWPLALLLPMR
jgi:hypothetical protein